MKSNGTTLFLCAYPIGTTNIIIKLKTDVPMVYNRQVKQCQKGKLKILFGQKTRLLLPLEMNMATFTPKLSNIMEVARLVTMH